MRYKMTDIDNEYFYMLPQSLFNYPQYRKLSIGAKVIYAILKNRMNMSRRNNWHNTDGDIYLEFSNEKLARILDVSRTTVSREIKALVKFGLIDIIDRRSEGRANLLYIHKIKAPEDASEIIDVEQETLEEEREAEMLSACEAVIRSNNAMSDGFRVRDDGTLIASDGSTHGSIYPSSVGECTYARGSNMMKMFNNPFMRNGYSTSPVDNLETTDVDRGVCADAQGGVQDIRQAETLGIPYLDRGVCADAQGGVQNRTGGCSPAHGGVHQRTGVCADARGCAPAHTKNKDYKQRTNNKDYKKIKEEDDDDMRARTRVHRKEVDEGYAQIERLFSENIHPVTGSIESDKLGEMYDHYGAEWCSEAIREAALRNGRSILYIEKVLLSWKRNGFKESTKPSKRSSVTHGVAWINTGTDKREPRHFSFMEAARLQPKPWRDRPDIADDIRNGVASYADQAQYDPWDESSINEPGSDGEISDTSGYLREEQGIDPIG